MPDTRRKPMLNKRAFLWTFLAKYMCLFRKISILCSKSGSKKCQNVVHRKLIINSVFPIANRVTCQAWFLLNRDFLYTFWTPKHIKCQHFYLTMHLFSAIFKWFRKVKTHMLLQKRFFVNFLFLWWKTVFLLVFSLKKHEKSVFLVNFQFLG